MSRLYLTTFLVLALVVPALAQGPIPLPKKASQLVITGPAVGLVDKLAVQLKTDRHTLAVKLIYNAVRKYLKDTQEQALANSLRQLDAQAQKAVQGSVQQARKAAAMAMKKDKKKKPPKKK